MLIGLWSASARPIPKTAGKYDRNDPHHFIMADSDTEYLSNLNDVFIDNEGNKITDIWSVTLPKNLQKIETTFTCLREGAFHAISSEENYNACISTRSGQPISNLKDLPQFSINVTMPNVKFVEIYRLCMFCKCGNTIINISDITDIDFTGTLGDGKSSSIENFDSGTCIKFQVEPNNPKFS